MLARERIERIIDPGTAFPELSPLAAYDLYDGRAPRLESSQVLAVYMDVKSSSLPMMQRSRQFVLSNDGQETHPCTNRCT